MHNYTNDYAVMLENQMRQREAIARQQQLELVREAQQSAQPVRRSYIQLMLYIMSHLPLSLGQ